MKRLSICLCGLISVASVVAGAEPPMITDRPDQSDSPSGSVARHSTGASA